MQFRQYYVLFLLFFIVIEVDAIMAQVVTKYVFQKNFMELSKKLFSTLYRRQLLLVGQ